MSRRAAAANEWVEPWNRDLREMIHAAGETVIWVIFTEAECQALLAGRVSEQIQSRLRRALDAAKGI